jgi:hypothetical protein
MILEAHRGPTSQYTKYTLSDKTGKAELAEGRVHFDQRHVGHQRVNPFKNTAARLNPATRNGTETIYILGHGGSTRLAGEPASSWANLLMNMGLVAHDKCVIDITACYVGDRGNGFAANLAMELATRQVKCRVIGPQGHIHDTATHTAIFNTDDDFYDELWDAAGHNDYGSAFTCNVARQLCTTLKATRPALEVAPAYHFFLDELLTDVAPACGIVPPHAILTELTHILLVIGQIAVLRNQETVIADVACRTIDDLLQQGPVEFSSAFISAMKRTYRNNEPHALSVARAAIKNEGGRVWQVHKDIIENQRAEFVSHAAPLPLTARTTFDSRHLTKAKAEVQGVMDLLLNRQYQTLSSVVWGNVESDSTKEVRNFLVGSFVKGAVMTLTAPLQAKFAPRGVGVVHVECQVSFSGGVNKTFVFPLTPNVVGFTWSKPIKR